MGNSFITNTARYQPFSYEELVKPIEHIQQLHDQTDQFYQATGMQAQNIATSLGDDNPIAMEMYNTFNTALNAASDDLLKNGYNPSTTKKLMEDARNSYITNMLPISKAITSRQEDAKRALEFQKAHPNSVFSSLSNVDAYLQGTNKPLGMVNMDDVYKKAMEAAKAISERTYTNGTTKSNVAGYIATYMQQGFTPEQAMQAAYNATDEKGNPLFPEFAVATANILNSTDYNTLDASGQSKVMSALSNGFNAGIMRKLDIDYHKNWIAEKSMENQKGSMLPITIPITINGKQGEGTSDLPSIMNTLNNYKNGSFNYVTSMPQVAMYQEGQYVSPKNQNESKTKTLRFVKKNADGSINNGKVATLDEFKKINKNSGLSDSQLETAYRDNVVNAGLRAGDTYNRQYVGSKKQQAQTASDYYTQFEVQRMDDYSKQVFQSVLAANAMVTNKSGKRRDDGNYLDPAYIRKVEGINSDGTVVWGKELAPAELLNSKDILIGHLPALLSDDKQQVLNKTAIQYKGNLYLVDNTIFGQEYSGAYTTHTYNRTAALINEDESTFKKSVIASTQAFQDMLARYKTQDINLNSN